MASYVVTNLNDSGAGSLRQAILDANANPGADDISFSPGLSGVITLAGGTLTVTDTLTIDGDTDGDDIPDIVVSGDVNGDDVTQTDDGVTPFDESQLTDAVANGNVSDNVQVFISQAPTTIDALAITGGGNAYYGGGFRGYGAGNVITNSIVSGNSGVFGGGAYNGGNGANLNTSNSFFSFNSGGIGGGLSGRGLGSIVNTTFENNFAGNNGGALAGGINNEITIVNSTFSGNEATNKGGPIYGPYNLTLINTTLSGNSSGGSGGAIWHVGDSTFHNVTITGNTAAGNGGGIFSQRQTAVRNGNNNLYNSIILSNEASVGNNINGSGAEYIRAPTIIDTVLEDAVGNQTSIGVTTADAAAAVFAATGPDPFTGAADAGVLGDNGGLVETVLILTSGFAQNQGVVATLPPDVGDVDGDADKAEPLPLDATGSTRVFDGALDLGAVELQVADPNNPPDAMEDAKNAPEDGPAVVIDVVANDTDPDGDTPLTVVAIDGMPIATGETVTLKVSGATVTLNGDGTLSYDPNGKFEGLGAGDTQDDAFVYTLRDTTSGTDTAIVTVTVDGADEPDPDAPTAVDDGPINVPEDGPAVEIDVLANDTDPTMDPLTITEIDGQAVTMDGDTVTLATGAVVALTNGMTKVSYDPNGKFEALNLGDTAPDSFTYKVSDGALTDTATVTITVDGADEIGGPPVAVDDPLFVFEDSTTQIDVTANDTDPDMDPLTVTQINGVAVNPGDVVTLDSGATATLDLSGTKVTYDPNTKFDGLSLGQSAADVFAYTIEDPTGQSDSAFVATIIQGVGGGDGFDLVFEASGGNDRLVLDGDPSQIVGLGEQGTFRGLGDVNGDGEIDLAYEFAGGGDQILLSGDPATVLGLGRTSGTLVGFADVNGDGDDDLIFEFPGGDEIVLSGISANSINLGEQGVLRGVADVNGDNKDDLLFEYSGGGDHVLLSGDPATDVFLGFVNGTLRAIADVNGDGDDDLVFESGVGNDSVLLSGTTPRGFGQQGNFRGVADINGDGKDDLIYEYNGGGDHVLLSGDPATDVFLGFEFASLVGVADVNGDNQDDLIYATASGEKIALSGDPSNIVDLGDPGIYLGAADVNNDGTDDLIFQTGVGEAILLSGDPFTTVDIPDQGTLVAPIPLFGVGTGPELLFA